MITIFSYAKCILQSNDGSQNTFVYQSTFDTLELRKYKITDCVLSRESKGAFNFKLNP